MRFLADAGGSPKTVEFLKRLGHEAVHVRTLGLQRAADPQLVERARADASVVLTFDLDFGEILALGILDNSPLGVIEEQNFFARICKPIGDGRPKRGTIGHHPGQRRLNQARHQQAKSVHP
jgi:hypothetical protein